MQNAPKFQMFPSSRLINTMPWQTWALGWLAMLKACLWVFITDVHNSTLLLKYLVLAAPFFILGVGIWNLRNWAFWGLAALCGLDLIIHLVLPDALIMIDSGPAGRRKVIYSTVLALISGPAADAGVLALLPFARSAIGRWELLKTEENA